MELLTYFQLARRYWWLLLLGPLVAGAAAFFVSKQMTPVYRTSTTILVNQTQSPGLLQYNDILTSERLTNTYAQLIKRDQIMSAVRNDLGLGGSLSSVSKRVSVSTIRNTQLLKISAEDPNPVLTAQLANATASAFIRYNSESLGGPGTVTIADPARIPTAPVKPNVRLNTTLAAAMGLLVVCGLVVLLEYLDDTVKATDEAVAGTGLPMLGVVRRLHREKRLGGPAVLDPETADAFLQLRTNVHFAGIGSKLKSILVTSAGPGEGKSTTAAGLAVVLAQAGERVIVVDTDLRRPSLHRIFGVPNSFGLTGLLLSDAADPSPALVESGVKNLRILPSGPLPPNPADLLMSSNMENIRNRLSSLADYVIFDSPPILAVTDASILAGTTAGTLLVAAAGKTRKTALKHAAQELVRTQTRIVGLIVNKARVRQGYYRYARGPHRLPQRQGEPPIANVPRSKSA